ncbi:hypothetical protein E7Y31_20795 [Candidatus Frankia alpina]|uniref:Uncharacterized protein n=1 Tax=Candidatus Frankia alpina TaxID=2699483 RepID=A0A4S5C6U1_9ACTN|nr:hypothetical protein E7Y31_20795 [Candidatus Frankia alpina]
MAIPPVVSWSARDGADFLALVGGSASDSSPLEGKKGAESQHRRGRRRRLRATTGARPGADGRRRADDLRHGAATGTEWRPERVGWATTGFMIVMGGLDC